MICTFFQILVSWFDLYTKTRRKLWLNRDIINLSVSGCIVELLWYFSCGRCIQFSASDYSERDYRSTQDLRICIGICILMVRHLKFFFFMFSKILPSMLFWSKYVFGTYPKLFNFFSSPPNWLAHSHWFQANFNATTTKFE